jgi:hypothetical protein
VQVLNLRLVRFLLALIGVSLDVIRQVHVYYEGRDSSSGASEGLVSGKRFYSRDSEVFSSNSDYLCVIRSLCFSVSHGERLLFCRLRTCFTTGLIITCSMHFLWMN